MRHFFILASSILLLTMIACSGKTQEINPYAPNGEGIQKAEEFGIKLALQSFTFHKFTLVETLDKVEALDIKYLEVYPGHKIGGKWGDKSFDFRLTEEERTEILALAKSKNVQIVGCGVFSTSNVAEWEQMFEFAKFMGLEFISCDPEENQWDVVEKLALETGIKAGVHNHPQPSRYWSPDLLLAQIKDRDKNLLGASADVGHWNREGLDQIDCLKQLEGRLVSLHFKDIEASKDNGEEQLDVIWGFGTLDIDSMLKELRRQNFKGYLAIEYERNWDDSMADIAECIMYYDIACYQIFNQPATK